ncbi:MAG: hypothetical protein C5B49_10420 [Bdellovibrio sp.]|nr:MAG: hypothetical protein C5B49_10420 [Bdellovibrio sp.]
MFWLISTIFWLMADQSRVERTVSSPDQTKSHLREKIDYIHTPPWRSKTFLEEKYLKEGRSIAQIAAQTLSSRAAVRDALIEFSIPLRKQGKPGKRPAQVPYGYRRADGLLVPHLGEQRVIQSARKMSNDGLSYRQICDFLTSVGVPTKNQGKGWQPEMIRRILTREATAGIDDVAPQSW